MFSVKIVKIFFENSHYRKFVLRSLHLVKILKLSQNYLEVFSKISPWSDKPVHYAALRTNTTNTVKLQTY